MSLPRKLPAYIFRGTTIGHPGSHNAQTFPYTCTSLHPVKALWFALACLQNAPNDAVVYVARTENLVTFSPIYNVLKKVEDEVGLTMKPLDFYPYCEGYMHVADLQKILQDMKIEAYNVARIDNISRLCRETKDLTVKNVITLVDEMQQYLKKS